MVLRPDALRATNRVQVPAGVVKEKVSCRSCWMKMFHNLKIGIGFHLFWSAFELILIRANELGLWP